MPWIWWASGAVCLLLFASLAGFNAWSVINYFRTGKHVSAIPLLGGIAGAIATIALPVDGLGRWWWIPLLLDYGTVPMFAYFFAWHLSAGIRKRGNM